MKTLARGRRFFLIGMMMAMTGCASPSLVGDEPVTNGRGKNDSAKNEDEQNAATTPPPASNEAKAPNNEGARPDGTIKFVTYNVGGLADLLSAGSPSKTTPLISPLLNAYDLVLVQEDFEYHDALSSKVTHPFKVKPKSGSFPSFYGDGLAMFSRLTVVGDVDHEAWDKCNGTLGAKNDCLADKGFVRVVVTVAPGKEIDVYDLHMDAGRTGDDAKARDTQASQLAEYIGKHSADRAIIIAGDTNMKESDEASLTRFVGLVPTLRDACRELACPQRALHDRIFVRDGATLKLSLTSWREETTFKTPAGESLSDHEPVAVEIGWTAK